MATTPDTVKKSLTPIERKKLESIIKSFSNEDLVFMMQYIPTHIIWNEAERRLIDAIDYKDSLVNIVKEREGFK
jgi:hypothetical protein